MLGATCTAVTPFPALPPAFWEHGAKLASGETAEIPSEVLHQEPVHAVYRKRFLERFSAFTQRLELRKVRTMEVPERAWPGRSARDMRPLLAARVQSVEAPGWAHCCF